MTNTLQPDATPAAKIDRRPPGPAPGGGDGSSTWRLDYVRPTPGARPTPGPFPLANARDAAQNAGMTPPESDPPAGAEARPDLGDIPARPKSPAVIRFLGCDAEMAGLSTDYFTAGRTDDCDLTLPDELGGGPSVVLRFSRGAQGWRVSPAEHQAVFVNQEQVRGLTPLRSGDVLRFAPGGAGMQFNIVHQNAAPLANLVAKYAPRLLGERRGPAEGPAGGDDSVVDGVAPLRYEAGGRAAASRAGAPAPAHEPPSRRIDPAVLVAGAILLAGAMLGAAVVFTAPGVSDSPAPPAGDAPPSENTPASRPPIAAEEKADEKSPSGALPTAPPVDPSAPEAVTPPPATTTSKPEAEPQLPPETESPPEPESAEPSDPEALIEDPFD